ncbi:hypothetical protein IFT69_15215 [Pseudomonas putida]|nr:hypothetical protein [Pseudomonas putida]
MPHFHRPDLAAKMAQQFLNPGVLDEGLRSGMFLSSPKHTGKTSFLIRDLAPALEAGGAIAIYVDLGSNTLLAPSELLKIAILGTLNDLVISPSPTMAKIAHIKGADPHGFVFKPSFELAALEGKASVTLAQVFREMVDQIQTDVVLIMDDVQQAILTDSGQSMLLALKAARDMINSRSSTPGYFIFIGAGSNPAILQEMVTKRSHAFLGATFSVFPLLGDGFVSHSLEPHQGKSGDAEALDVEVAREAFSLLGFRPDLLTKAMALTFRHKAAPNEVMPIVASTLRATVFDRELEKVSALGDLAKEIFSLIASSEEPVGKLFSVSSADYYTIAIGRLVKIEEIQPVVNELVLQNMIIRVGHGLYAISNQEVGLAWRERLLLVNEGEGKMTNMTQGVTPSTELDFSVEERKEDGKVIQIIKIYADNREARSGVIKALQKMDNVEVTVMDLPCGDYILSPEVAVERKSATDFVNSVMSGHIFEQVARMQIDYVRPMVLIEGDPIRTRSAIKPEAVAGAMSSLMTVQKISLVSVADVTETAIMIATMARHLQHGLGYAINLHPKKPKPTQHAKNYVISSFPDLGPGTAAKLLAHFGTIYAVVTASTEQLMGVKGIGPKSAARIFELIHHP